MSDFKDILNCIKIQFKIQEEHNRHESVLKMYKFEFTFLFKKVRNGHIFRLAFHRLFKPITLLI